MKISYKKLWIRCAEKEITLPQLRKVTGIAPGTFTKLRKNEEVSLSVLMKIAEVLDCNVGDILDFIKVDKESRLLD